ncbi:PhzF family phenazine biosynthesis protein [Hydrogenophaga sp. 5NK40-0174]|uniref:PhzF family phenazine biosynthesis protein n=1 Tax=Hydrogenophaga sp. 5NK40-0174 TaxID=3127649 RepID=UPI0031070C96
MPNRPYKQVDVFTETPYRGNPLGVVLDGQGLSAAEMQHFTQWTNLSECTFVLPPSPEGKAQGADYRVRIFCPGRELPFAGHPTLGTCHAWLEAGGQAQGNEVIQECGAGLIRIRRNSGRLAFAAPPLQRSGPLDEADVQRIAQGLGIAREGILHHAWCDNGPQWMGVMLRDAETVRTIRPDGQLLAGLDIGVVAPQTEGQETQFEVRAFFPGNSGLCEDPVTGSLNAAIAQWLLGAGLAPEQYVAAQGTQMERQGRVHVQRDSSGAIWVGGASVTCIQGEVCL